MVLTKLSINRSVSSFPSASSEEYKQDITWSQLPNGDQQQQRGTLSRQEGSQRYALHRLGRGNGLQQKAEILACSSLMLMKQRHLLRMYQDGAVQELGTVAPTLFTLLLNNEWDLRQSGPILQIFLLIKTGICSHFSNRLQLQKMFCLLMPLDAFFRIQQYDKDTAFNIFLSKNNVVTEILATIWP